MNKCLITRPDHDKVTSYLFHWSKEILEFPYKREIQFLDLREKKANKKDVESYLKKQNPRLVLFNGHGNDESICGFKDEPLIELGKNEGLLKGKIIYALSCSCANKLGKEAVKIGCDVFIGYKDSFLLYTDSEREATPLKDKIAASFLENLEEVSLEFKVFRNFWYIIIVLKAKGKNAVYQPMPLFRKSEYVSPLVSSSM